MTAKRFTEIISLMTVKDNQTGKEYKCEMGIDEELLDLLNEQHDRIKWLEERVSQLECFLELDKLHKEVEDGKMDKFVEWRCE